MAPLVTERSELYLLLPNKHIFLCRYQSRTFPSATCCQLIVLPVTNDVPLPPK